MLRLVTKKAIQHDDNSNLFLKEKKPLLNQRITQQCLSVAGFVGAVALWQILSLRFPPIILPSPWIVIGNLVQGFLSGYYLPHLAVTLEEILLGFIIGSLIGIGVGAVLARSPILRNIFNPFIVISQAVPKVALAPLFIIWLGFGILPKVTIAAVITFFPLLENTITGLNSVDQDTIDLLRTYRASGIQVMLKLRIPHALPFIFSGLRVAGILSVIGAIIGEYVGASKGLGAVIVAAQGMADTSLMFAIFVILTLLGIGLYRLIESLEAVALRRRGVGE